MQNDRPSITRWLQNNWLELLLLGILVLALYWAGRTVIALLPKAAPEPAGVPTMSAVDSLESPSETPDGATPARRFFDGTIAQGYVGSQVALGPRAVGTSGHKAVSELIVDELNRSGWLVEESPFDLGGIPMKNLIAKTGSGNAGLVIIASHYDTSPVADLDPGIENRDSPVPGANDGGSGTAVLLELARIMDQDSLNSEVWLAFLDGHYDPRGLTGEPISAGATFLAQNLSTEPDAVVLIDLAGDADQLLLIDGNSDPDLSRELWDIGERLGYSRWFVPETEPSFDNGVFDFRSRDIPAANIVDADYTFLRTSQDTTDKIRASSLDRVGRVLQEYLEN